MLNRMGVDPESIADEDKVERPNFTPGEIGSLAAVKQQHPKLGFFQLASAKPVRGLPPADSALLALKLAEATPEVHWLCLHDEFVPKDYKEALESKAIERKQSNVQLFCAANLRELWALAESASIVVSPDSMMIHVAGIFGVPCVGLWGPMDPYRRTRYYKNHTPLWHKEFCPH
jgi:ADP-heptose:LPS heptosyltransferase